MSDVEKAYKEINEFLHHQTEKTLLFSGIADKPKHRLLLKALNEKGNLQGLIFLIRTTRSGMSDFFGWAGLQGVKVPKKYGEGMRFLNLTIFFNNLTTKSISNKDRRHEFDFMIIWPIQSVTKNHEEVQMLKELAKVQKTKKIIYLTLKEPWCNPDLFRAFVDREIRLDCENDDPEEYQRILDNFEQEMKRRKHM